MKTIIFTVLAVAISAGQATAQQSIVVVRHAERSDATPGKPVGTATDPHLSDAGHARAATLAATLKDAGITAIVASEYKRTQQTAAPLAKILGLPVTAIRSTDIGQIVKAVKSSTGNVLVVGHSNTIPDIIKALGAPPPSPMHDDEFDNLYLVTLGRPPSVVRLHYQQ